MASELRVRTNFLGGLVEDNPLASGATTLTSAGLASLPAIGATQHMAIILDPDGRAGNPEIAYVTAHTAAATTATITKAQEGTTGRAHDRDTPWLHGPTIKDFDAAGGGAGLIGFMTPYASASDGAATFTTTSTTLVDVDATNVVVAFTGPPSGKVLVAASFACREAGGNNVYAGLRDSGGIVAGTQAHVATGANMQRPNFRAVVTGLTPGTAYSYKLAYCVDAGTGGIWSGPTRGKIFMDVWAVNL